jgi:hypothetical protein
MIKQVKGKNLVILLSLLMLVFSIGQELKCQIQINSPYTRYGVGTLVENGMDPRITAMGGLSFGFRSNNLINTANPASYTAFDSVSFIFDGGIFGMISSLKTSQQTDQGDYISLSHLMFGLPVTRWWRTSLGILPFSFVGYDIYVNEEIENQPDVEHVYRGSGGYNQLYWGNAFLIAKKLSVGFNMKYMFGSIYRSRGITFPDSVEIKNTYIRGSIRPNDIYGEIGVQYKTKLPKNLFLVVGGVFGPQTEINTKASYLVTTYFGEIGSVQYTYDTIDYSLNEQGSFTLPIRTGAGFTVGQEGKWIAGVDFMWQNWEKYTYYGNSDSLKNRWNMAIGGEYIPNAQSIGSYFQKVAYRAGVHYGKTPLYFNGQHLNEFGMSFGLGLPIKKSKSTVNLSVAVGKQGTIQYGLIQENFIRFTIGVNVFENWFFKSKYY